MAGRGGLGADGPHCPSSHERRRRPTRSNALPPSAAARLVGLHSRPRRRLGMAIPHCRLANGGRAFFLVSARRRRLVGDSHCLRAGDGRRLDRSTDDRNSRLAGRRIARRSARSTSLVGLVRDDRNDRNGGHCVDLLRRRVRALSPFNQASQGVG